MVAARKDRTMPPRRGLNFVWVCFYNDAAPTALTGAPQCGHVRAWSLTCPLHSWHWMRGILFNRLNGFTFQVSPFDFSIPIQHFGDWLAFDS